MIGLKNLLNFSKFSLNLEDAKEKIDAWKWDYNLFRPHSSLNNLSPQEFIIL